MNKDFLRSATLLIAVNLLIKPLYIFGIDRTLQNIVGTAEYGIYFALFNYTLFGQVLLDFGINNFNNRAIAQQHHLLTSYLPTFLRLKVLLALAYMGSCFVGAMLLNYNLHQQKLLFWLALSQILASFGAFFRSNLQGLHLFGKDSLVSVTDRLFLIVVVGSLLLLYKGMDILQFAYLQTAAYAITAGVGALLFDRFKINETLKKEFGLQVNVGTEISKANQNRINTQTTNQAVGQVRSATTIEVKKQIK